MSSARTVVTVGCLVPFTGPPGLRVNAPTVQAGMMAALAEYDDRRAGSSPSVRLLTCDNGYDADVTKRAVFKLVEHDGVTALLNANGTPQIEPLLPYLQAKRVPLLLPFAGADTWYDPPRAGVLGLNPPFREIGVLLGRWAARDGHRRVAVLHPNFPPVSVEMARHVQTAFEQAIAEARAERVQVELANEDGVAMADAVERAAPDAIVILTNWPELRALAGELRRRGIELPLYTWSANVTQFALQQLGDLVEGMKGHSPLIVTPLSDAESVQRFRASLERVEPGQSPDFVALQAYAHTTIFVEALSRIEGAASWDTLLEAFYSFDNFETDILPPVSFSPSRHLGVREVQPMRVERSHWVPFGARERLPFSGRN